MLLGYNKNMMQKIAKEFKSAVFSVAKIFCLAVLCVIFGAVVVLPLWKWAVTSPKTYTAAILFVAAVLFIFFFVKKIRKIPPRVIFRRAIKIILSALEIWIFISNVFALRRMVAFVSLFLYVLAMIFLSLLMKNGAKK